MTSQAAVHKRNLESSILFLQQEHADTLKGLHEEISKLQKRCSELTFHLSMHGLEVGDDGEVVDKHKDLKKQIEDFRIREKQLQSQLEKRDAVIKKFEQELKVQKRKVLDESRSQSQTVNALKADLEAKSHTVAFLTTELHKLKLQQSAGINLKENSANTLPHPPAENSAKSKRSSHMRRTLPLTNHSELDKRPLRVVSGGKMRSGGSSRSDSPSDQLDISPFLKHEGEEHMQMKPILTQPLPPILDKSKPERKEIFIHKVIKPKELLMRKKKSSESAAVQTLAVDQVTDSKVWTPIQESRSSEYN